MRAAVTGVAAVALASLGIAACGGGGSSTKPGGNNGNNKGNTNYGTIVSGKLPAQGTPKQGGTLSVGIINGQTPTYISPLNPGSACGTWDFQLFSSLYIPLYYGPKGASPTIDESQSLANAPVYSDSDKTVTISLKSGLKWSNGEPVDAQDVIFYMDLLKAALKKSSANWCQYTPGEFPDNVASYSASGPDTVVFHLKSSVNPTWFTLNQLQDTNGGVYALPSKAWNVNAAGQHLDYANPANAAAIYENLNTQAEKLTTFATNPLWKVVDGPYKLKSFSATNGSYDLVPNPSFGLADKSHYSQVDFESYSDSAAVLNAFKAHTLDLGELDPATQYGSFESLDHNGYDVFGTPGWGWYGGYINFEDGTNDFGKVISQQYVREAFAYMVNQPEVIKDVYHGWAVPAYGPVATAPYSQFVPKTATANPYPFNPSKAVSLLKAHGWDVKPGGTTTCAKPGTASDECGAGIPKGTPIEFTWFNLPESTSGVGQLESEQLASTAEQAAGIKITLLNKTVTFLSAEYANSLNPKNKNDWGVNNYGGVFYDFYPTQNGILTPGASFNFGTYSDPEANKLMDASIVSPNRSAIINEVSYLAKSYPIFWEPDEDQVWAVANSVGGSPDAFLSLSTQQVPSNLLYPTDSSTK